MPAAYTNDLINEIKAALRDMFYAGDSTMIIIQYEKSGAAEETMQAIADVRALCNEKCFLAGFSVVIKDTKALSLFASCS